MEDENNSSKTSSTFIWSNTKNAFCNFLKIFKCSSCNSKEVLFMTKCCKELMCLSCEDQIEKCRKCDKEKLSTKLNDVDVTLKSCSILSKILNIDNKFDLKNAKSSTTSASSSTPSVKTTSSSTPSTTKTTSTSSSAPSTTTTSLPRAAATTRSSKRKLNSSLSTVDRYFSKQTTPKTLNTNDSLLEAKKIKIESGVVARKSPIENDSNDNKTSNRLNMTTPCNKSLTKRLNKRNNKGETALHVACIKGDTELVKNLLNEGFDPNVKDNALWTPLHEACHHGHTLIVEELLNHSAFVDEPGYDDYTPLHDAVEQDQQACALLLLKYGADVNKRTSSGHTAFELAKCSEMEETLLNHKNNNNDDNDNNNNNNKQIIMTSSPSSSSLPSFQPIGTPKHRPQHRLVITCSGFRSGIKSWISKTVANLNWTFKDEFDETVTHLIPSTNEKRLCVRTMKYMSALLLGKWIVHLDWLEACSKNNGWIEESDYEINGCFIHPDPSILHRSRNSTALQLPKLFKGGNFYLSPKLPTSLKSDLTSLIKYGSGKISLRAAKLKLEELGQDDGEFGQDGNNCDDVLNQSIINHSTLDQSIINQSTLDQSIINHSTLDQSIINHSTLDQSITNQSILNQSMNSSLTTTTTTMMMSTTLSNANPDSPFVTINHIFVVPDLEDSNNNNKKKNDNNKISTNKRSSNNNNNNNSLIRMAAKKIKNGEK